MSNTVIEVESLSKQYRLGQVGTGSLSHDLNRFWHRLKGNDDPYLQVGEENTRESKGNSDYVWALKDINFNIQQGDRVGIIGRNGAGKSTLLKILSRTTSPSTGSVKIKGRVSSLLEVGTGFHPDLSGRDNIFLNGAILGMSKQDITNRLDEIINFAGVERYIDTPVKRYSSGMYVRLAFAVAAHLESDILIVDEVLAVGDAEFQKKCLSKLGDVSKGEGRTILFVSHNIGAVNRLCNQLILMEKGKVVHQGDLDTGYNLYKKNLQKKYQSLFITPTTLQLNSLAAYISSVELLNSSIVDLANDESLSFKVTIVCNERIVNHRIGLKINSSDNNPVGLLFTDSIISVNQAESADILFKLSNHNLARGVYLIDFSLGTGNEIHPITDLHIIHEALIVEVSKKTIDSAAIITNWNTSNWGNTNYKSPKIEVRIL